MKTSGFRFQVSGFLACALVLFAHAQQTTVLYDVGDNTLKRPTAAQFIAANLSGLSTVYQPLSANLTSWAAITRASGFDTFVAAPSSANFRSLITDESGTGVLFFAGGNFGAASGTSVTLSSLTSGRVSFATTSGLLTDDSDLTFDGQTLGSLGYKATSNTTTYGATTTLDARQSLQTVSLTGNVTFATSNRAAGQFVTVRVICDASNRTLTFPSWKFVGTVAPATITASKTALLTLVCFGTLETDIVASWVVEP